MRFKSLVAKRARLPAVAVDPRGRHAGPRGLAERAAARRLAGNRARGRDGSLLAAADPRAVPTASGRPLEEDVGHGLR